MPQEVLFSAPGIELVIFREEGSLSAAIILNKKDITIARELKGEELILFYRATRFLINRNLASEKLIDKGNKDSGDIEESVLYNGNNTLYSKTLFFFKRALLSQLNTREFEQNVFEWLANRQQDDFTISLKKSELITSKRVEAEVFIGLPQEDISLFTIEHIQNATGAFMDAMGFELETQDEPVYGSFFQKLKYLLKKEVKQEAGELYAKGKIALETQFIDLPSAEATDKLASAAAGLIMALNGVSDAAIRCGAILLVKVTKDGVPRIVTETVSPELAALLNKNPALLQNPSIVFDLISGMRAPDKTIEERGSTEVIE